jgi:hypothetical protein
MSQEGVVKGAEKKRSHADNQWIIFVGARNGDMGLPEFLLFKTQRTEFFTREVVEAMHLTDPSDRTQLGVPGCNCTQGTDLDESVWEEIQPTDLMDMDGHVVVVGYLDD